MIESHKLDRLQAKLGEHGQVISLVELPNSDKQQECLLLATMRSPEDAINLQANLGLSIFGFNAVIISAGWIDRHLPATPTDSD